MGGLPDGYVGGWLLQGCQQQLYQPPALAPQDLLLAVLILAWGLISGCGSAWQVPRQQLLMLPVCLLPLQPCVTPACVCLLLGVAAPAAAAPPGGIAPLPHPHPPHSRPWCHQLHLHQQVMEVGKQQVGVQQQRVAPQQVMLLLVPGTRGAQRPVLAGGPAIPSQVRALHCQGAVLRVGVPGGGVRPTPPGFPQWQRP